MTLCSLLCQFQFFKGKCCFHLQGKMPFNTSIMNAMCSSEQMLANHYIILCYNPEYRNIKTEQQNNASTTLIFKLVLHAM